GGAADPTSGGDPNDNSSDCLGGSATCGSPTGDPSASCTDPLINCPDPMNPLNNPPSNPTNPCSSIQQSYNSTAGQSNFKWWARFWGSTAIGGAGGGFGGALVAGGIALLYDDSREEYNNITQNANQQ